jgi:hypothetical protein
MFGNCFENQFILVAYNCFLGAKHFFGNIWRDNGQTSVEREHSSSRGVVVPCEKLYESASKLVPPGKYNRCSMTLTLRRLWTMIPTGKEFQ